MKARIAGEASIRSIAGQVEFWARIGKAVEGLLTGQQMHVIGRSSSTESVLKRLDTVDSSEGRQRVKDYLASQPYPHYFVHPELKGVLIREEEDGRKVAGRFLNREFVLVDGEGKVCAA